ncbi:MAG: hypothetical protein HZA89_10055 [Verrucomicrobia bacterium]|nr:hypothetical protein [Verrucomicrobiota bacterium]
MNSSASSIARCHLCLWLLAAFFAAASAHAQPYVPGQTYFGRSNYIEYIAGNLPFIISAPHGGTNKPAELPDRTYGTFATDTATDTLARTIRTVFTNRFGGLVPHVIICNLDRDKIDCNREIIEGAQGNTNTEIAWNEFQNFIATAKQTVSNQFGRGFYIDLHGHGHPIQQLEIGYLLSAGELAVSDATLDAGTNYSGQSSIKELDQRSLSSFSELLRGPTGFGSLMAAQGFPSVPSQAVPDPGTNSYFNGGYNTVQHGSLLGGTISGLQIESNYTNVRNNSVSRTNFANALATALDTYFSNHFAMNLHDAAPAVTSLTNQTINASGSVGPLGLTIADSLTPLAQLVLRAASSNTNLVPLANIVFTGSGSNRFVTVTPVPYGNGSSTITITVTDTNGGMATASFTLTVNPTGSLPLLTAVNYDPARTGLNFRLVAVAGQSHTVEYSDDLQAQIWNPLFSVTNPAGVLHTNDKLGTNNSPRFYRVRQEMSP